MWFAKWFGGRKEKVEDDEPARFSAPVRIDPPAAAVPPPALKPAPKAAAKAPGGFDPYNSGSFERGNAWERVKRR